MVLRLGLLKLIENQLKDKAFAEGFEAIGICGPEDVPLAAKRLDEFLKEGRHGKMDWMERRAEWRRDPQKLWPEAKSVIMFADSYAPTKNPLTGLKFRDKGCISVYAQNKDYHEIIKKKLKRIGRWLIAKTNSEIKVFVDTAPVMEKPLAEAAGIGWQGKHTNLVSKNLGSWFFLGAIFTTVQLVKDKPEVDHCGSCRRCLDICPTNAFPKPYQLDARLCISYLTIEHKESVDEQLRPALGNRIFGCDDCLAVCPWNKFAVEAQKTHYQARQELSSLDLNSLARLTDTEFRTLFRDGPVRRIGRDRFVRNVLYAIGNSNNRESLPVANSLCSDLNPVVADAADWACNQLVTVEQSPVQSTNKN